MVQPFKMKRSIAGASHGYKNCQDACGIDIIPETEIFIAAVADGHGSPKCKYSDRGAKIAVKAFEAAIKELWKLVSGNQEDFIRLLRQRESVDLVKKIHKEWYESIKKSGQDLNLVDCDKNAEIDAELYGTTLLGMVIAPDFVFALQIGDGDIAFINDEGTKYVIDPPKFLGTETYSLSNQRPWEHAVTYFQRIDLKKVSPYMFLITTDGFANSYRDTEQYKIACKNYFDAIKQYGPELIKRQLPKWLKKTSTDGCGDDITFLAIGAIN